MGKQGQLLSRLHLCLPNLQRSQEKGSSALCLGHSPAQNRTHQDMTRDSPYQCVESVLKKAAPASQGNKKRRGRGSGRGRTASLLWAPVSLLQRMVPWGGGTQPTFTAPSDPVLVVLQVVAGDDVTPRCDHVQMDHRVWPHQCHNHSSPSSLTMVQLSRCCWHSMGVQGMLRALFLGPLWMPLWKEAKPQTFPSWEFLLWRNQGLKTASLLCDMATSGAVLCWHCTSFELFAASGGLCFALFI